MKVAVFLFVIVTSLNQSLSQRDDSINLCDSDGDVNYGNYTSNVIQNCGCENRTQCVRKCCQEGFQLYHEGDPDDELSVSVCAKTEQHSFNVAIYNGTNWARNEADRFLIGRLNCNAGTLYRKVSNSDLQQKFYIQADSSLYYLYDEKLYGVESYCLDDQDGLTAYLCFTPNLGTGNTENPVFSATLIHMIAKFVSLPFLAITGIVYALLPERNLRRNALMNHVFSLIPGSALIAVGQHIVTENDFLCYCQGFLALFFMVASFFWMNVICIDIALSFSGWRGLQVPERMEKILIIASLYAWGLPALNVATAIILNTFGDETTSYYPGVGIESCFLRNGLPAVIYYFIPILILILINFGLFIMTAVNICKAQKEIKMAKNKKCANTDEYSFKLYWKLLFVMGLNPVVNTHVIQVISWFLGTQMTRDKAMYIWYYKDFSHACYGLVIFLIFVCQKRIWVAVRGRFNCIWKFNKNESKASVTSSLGSKIENDIYGIRLRGIQLKENIP